MRDRIPSRVDGSLDQPAKPPAEPIPAEVSFVHAETGNAWFGATRIAAAPFMRGGELSKGQLTARKENFHSSRFTARSLCRNRGPCWSARPPSLSVDVSSCTLLTRFSVPPSLCGLSSPLTPLPAVACFPAPVGLRLAELVLVGGSSVRFQLSAGRCRAVFAFPVCREDIIANSLTMSQYEFAYSIITR